MPFVPDAKPQGGRFVPDGMDFQGMQHAALNHEQIRQGIDADPISQGARQASQETTVGQLLGETVGRYGGNTVGRWLGGNPDASYAARVAAAPATRFAVGAAAPWMGLGQIGEKAIGRNDTADYLNGYNDLKEQGGAGGFDAMGALGTAMSPMALRMAAGAPAATAMGRIGQGAVAGAKMGAAMPVTGPDYWQTKGEQILSGGAAGAAIPGVWEGAKAVGRGARNVFQPYMGQWGADRAAGRLANDAAGAKRDAVLAELRGSQPTVPGPMPTAGQAATNANSAEFSALQKIAAERDPSSYYGPSGIEGQQNAARIAALRTVGQTPQDLAAAIAERNASTAPLRETALANANIAGVKVPELQGRLANQNEALVNALQDKGRFESTAAQQDVLAHGGASVRGNLSPSAYPVPGYPRIPGRYSQNIDRVPEAQSAASDTAQILANRKAQAGLSQYQLDSLAAHGHYPLEAQKVVGAIDSMLATPGDRAVTLNQKILGAVREKIASLADKNGVIDSRDLYAVRKTDINDVVASLTKDMDASTKTRAASLVNSIKSDIDNAIEGAGGTGWKDYLKTYADKSRNIDQMKIGQEIESKLVPALSDEAKQRSAAYAEALRNATGTIKRATGQPRFESLDQIMTPGQMNTLGGVQSDLARNATFEALAQKGAPEAHRALNLAVPEIGSVGMFSPKISVARSVYNRVTGHATDKIINDLSTIMKDPQQMAKVMESAKPFKRRALIDALLKYQAAGTANAVSQGVQ